MQTAAPAHRYLIARKIAKNLGILREQDCFTAECRMIFSNLSRCWTAKADQLAPREDRPRGGIGMLRPAVLKARQARSKSVAAGAGGTEAGVARRVVVPGRILGHLVTQV